MVKYQGSKQRYAGDIHRELQNLSKDYYSLPFWECCCGSAVVSEYINKPTNLVDSGEWGRFWSTIYEHRDKVPIAALAINKDDYKDWVKYAAEAPIPKDPITRAMTFLALQREAFNGKPVSASGTHWVTPGLGTVFSYQKWRGALHRATNLRINSVYHTDLNYFTVPKPANIYLDPDYENTTGYSNTLYLSDFIRRHKHCNLIISHHTKLPQEFDKVVDVSQGFRSTHAPDPSEYLHIKRRVNEASNTQSG